MIKASIFNRAKFLLSAHNLKDLPRDEGIEIAVIGRSNVGKSSVLNRLTNQKRLAKTSKLPGRTRMINFFTLTERSRLVDLPGYGYARVSNEIKRHWMKVLNSYLSKRKSLYGLVLIIDIRRELTKEDLDIIAWAVGSGRSLHVVLNKADKLSFNKTRNALTKIRAKLARFEGNISLQFFSALKNEGITVLQDKILAWLTAVLDDNGN